MYERNNLFVRSITAVVVFYYHNILIGMNFVKGLYICLSFPTVVHFFYEKSLAVTVAEPQKKKKHSYSFDQFLYVFLTPDQLFPNPTMNLCCSMIPPIWVSQAFVKFSPLNLCIRSPSIIMPAFSVCIFL